MRWARAGIRNGFCVAAALGVFALCGAALGDEGKQGKKTLIVSASLDTEPKADVSLSLRRGETILASESGSQGEPVRLVFDPVAGQGEYRLDLFKVGSQYLKTDRPSRAVTKAELQAGKITWEIQLGAPSLEIEWGRPDGLGDTPRYAVQIQRVGDPEELFAGCRTETARFFRLLPGRYVVRRLWSSVVKDGRVHIQSYVCPYTEFTVKEGRTAKGKVKLVEEASFLQDVTIRLVDERGKAIKFGPTVRLDRSVDGKRVRTEVVADSSGKAAFTQLKPGTYELAVLSERIAGWNGRPILIRVPCPAMVDQPCQMRYPLRIGAIWKHGEIDSGTVRLLSEPFRRFPETIRQAPLAKGQADLGYWRSVHHIVSVTATSKDGRKLRGAKWLRPKCGPVDEKIELVETVRCVVEVPRDYTGAQVVFVESKGNDAIVAEVSRLPAERIHGVAVGLLPGRTYEVYVWRRRHNWAMPGTVDTGQAPLRLLVPDALTGEAKTWADVYNKAETGHPTSRPASE